MRHMPVANRGHEAGCYPNESCDPGLFESLVRRCDSERRRGRAGKRAGDPAGSRTVFSRNQAGSFPVSRRQRLLEQLRSGRHHHGSGRTGRTGGRSGTELSGIEALRRVPIQCPSQSPGFSGCLARAFTSGSGQSTRADIVLERMATIARS
jgi:hypothetical protein